MPSFRGAGMLCPPLMAACAPILVYKNTVFGTSHNDKTTDSDGKIAVHKSDAILRLNYTPLRMCRGRDT